MAKPAKSASRKPRAATASGRDKAEGVPLIDRKEADAFFSRASDSSSVREAAAALDRVAAEHDLAEKQRLAMRRALFDTLGQVELVRESRANLPARPPEEWSQRKGRKENPIAFIERVYGEWLDRGLTRSHLLALDRPLYTALGVWLHRHPDADLPGLLSEGPSSRGRRPHARISSLPSRQARRHK